MIHNAKSYRLPSPTETVHTVKLAKGERLLLPASNVEACRFFALENESYCRRTYTLPDVGEYVGYAPPTVALYSKPLRAIVSRLYPEYTSHIASSLSARKPRPSETQSLSFLEKLAQLPLTPKAFKYDRAIGIEIETSCPASIEQSQKFIPYFVRSKSDGSIRPKENEYGVEFAMLLKRSQMEIRLNQTLSALSKLGCSVNKSCGLHVHFDMRGKSLSDVQKLARKVTGWLKCLVELLPESRRENSYAKLAYSATDRYSAVNVTAYAKYQTLEVRIHSATLDYTKVLCWIRLIELLMAVKAAPRCEDTLSALSSLPLGEHERAYWLNRHRQLNPANYSAAQIDLSDSGE